MIEINNPKLYKLIAEKDALVKQGRKISSELETIEFKIQKLQDKEKVITGKHEPKDLMTRGEIVRLELERKMKEFDEISKEIHTAKLAAIPEDMKKKHYELMDLRTNKEEERNKIALKIQKYKDKMVPLLKKEIAPHLGEFEDTESVELKGDKIVVKTFNYVDEFKRKFKEKK